MKQKYIIFILLVIIAILVAVVIFQTISNNQQEPTETQPKDAFEEIYAWLLDNGKLTNGTNIGKSLKYENTLININYNSNLNDYILITMSFPKHKGNPLELEYYVYKDIDNKNVKYGVELTDNSTNKYVTKEYTLNSQTFVKNSPVQYEDTFSIFGKFYANETDPAKRKEYEVYKTLCTEIDKIHYDCFLTFLDWMKNDFCQCVGITMKDFGYLKYQ